MALEREIIALKHMMNIMEELEPKKTLTARKLMRREIMRIELAKADKIK